MGNRLETVSDFIFLSAKITPDGDCSHEIKRRLLLGRKVMTNLSSVQSLSLVWLFATQHARPPCPSPTRGVHSNSRPSSWWCHPAISSSVVPFSSCPQSFPASGSFQMSQLFASGGQNIGVSASTSVLPMNTQDWSPLGLVGPPCSPRDSQESSPIPQFKSMNSSALSFLHSPTSTQKARSIFPFI